MPVETGAKFDLPHPCRSSITRNPHETLPPPQPSEMFGFRSFGSCANGPLAMASTVAALGALNMRDGSQGPRRYLQQLPLPVHLLLKLILRRSSSARQAHKV